MTEEYEALVTDVKLNLERGKNMVEWQICLAFRCKSICLFRNDKNES